MRAVLQRVRRARVLVEGAVIGEIERGLLIYAGVAPGDGPAEVEWLARKLAEMRIFPDEQGRFDRSLIDVRGAALVVSQFTLFADTRKGRRPSFVDAAPPAVAEPVMEQLMQALRDRGLTVAGGRFGAHMAVESENDGPVTIMLDSVEMQRPRRG